jgi:hypothetical protein
VLRPEDKLDQSAAWYKLFLTAIGLTTDGNCTHLQDSAVWYDIFFNYIWVETRWL